MTDANRKTYPMVVGGQKVLQGMAYGTDASGIFKDSIYETVDNRYRYTSVLVGMPANQYKVDYAFRGYATLTKDERVLQSTDQSWQKIFIPWRNNCYG